MEKIKVKEGQVVCGIVVGNLETKESSIHWLSEDEFESYTKFLTECV